MENILLKNSEVSADQGSLFVLVHGAWAAPFAWKKVQELLSSKGHVVVTPQLPGHGSDDRDPGTLRMDSYIAYVTDVIKSAGKNVILVGHSMAGMIVSGVAEQVPDLVDKLVYVAAYVPQNGESAYAISTRDTQSLLGASLIVSEDQATFDVKLEDAVSIFCQDAPFDVQKEVLENYKPEPAAPFADEVALSEGNFGRVPKYYIETLQDHGIGNQLQKEMISAAKISRTFEMNTGHCPMLSQPEMLTEILLKIVSQA